MRLNWLYVMLCFFVVQPSYAATTPLTGISKIAVGELHTCALTTSGGVKCWGDNQSGQLGNGTTVGSLIPVSVTGLTSGVTAISVGVYFTCALTTNGAVKCWGSNYYGQLGNGTTVNSLIPVSVTGLTSGVTAISAGSYHICALTTEGVKCWGRNNSAQLGNGSQTNSTVPVSVTGLTNGVSAISAGASHTCALTTNGVVKCWGLKMGIDLHSFQISTGPFVKADPYTSVPEDVTGKLSDITAISAGSDFTCALTTTNGVKCWGLNNGYQLGDGTRDSRSFPEYVTGLTSGIKAISGTCALTDSGGVKCWGHDNSTLQNIAGLSNVTAISAGYSHACALTTTSGSVKCWGDNFYGQLGNGTDIVDNSWFIPTDVSNTKPTTYTFSTAKTGNGDITASTVAGSYDSGTKITLTAVPATGSTFTGWTPSTCVNGFALTANTICTATFSTTTACVAAQNLGVTKTENSAVSLEIPSISLCGGIQVKSGTRQNKVVQNLSDDVDVRATINIDSDNYVGQAADLVVHAIYKPLNSTASLNFMLNESGAPILWEKTLVPFKSNVTLSKTQEVVMYKGKFVGTGQLLVYLGVRLKKDGIVISNSTPIDILINP